jgi:LacI family transcriptional regulator
VITNYPNREEKLALQDPFVSEMIGALENAIRSRGYFTMLYAAQNATEIHRIAQTWNAVGLIVMGLQANQCHDLMRATRKPIVFIDCYFDEGERYNNIGLDDQEGMRCLTQHLLDMGHRDILYIGDQPVLWGLDARRLTGHIAALSKAGVAWNDAHYFCISKDRKRRPDDFMRLAARVDQKRDTAWMFISDYYAVEAIDFLVDHGYRVPEDISVTGFDDNILARVIRPRLTTVHQNVPQKAEMAIKTLFELLSGQMEAPFTLTLPTRLVRGESVRKIEDLSSKHTN